MAHTTRWFHYKNIYSLQLLGWGYLQWFFNPSSYIYDFIVLQASAGILS